MAENTGARQLGSGKYRMFKGDIVRKKKFPYADDLRAMGVAIRRRAKERKLRRFAFPTRPRKSFDE